MNKVTAVLLRWKRHEELKKIEAHLLTLPFIDEIIIWDNTEQNSLMYGRFLAAMTARNETIYVQDDDCIIENVEELYENYVGHEKRRLVNGMKKERISFYRGRDTLLGWGAFFERSWIACLQMYVDKYGRDAVFHREADRIFTSLLRVPRVTMIADVKDFPSAMAGHSLSLQRDHETSKALALYRAQLLRGEV